MFAITERLLLRPGWPDDARELAAAIADERIARNLARMPWPYSEDDAHSFLSGMFSGAPVEFLITLRTSGAIIGGIGIQETPDGHESHELGYWIAQRHWGKGIATEAGRAVMNIGRHVLRLDRIGSAWFSDNPASGKVLQKLGFRRAGPVAPRHSVGRGGPVPAVLMVHDLAEAQSDGPVPPRMQMQMQMAA